MSCVPRGKFTFWNTLYIILSKLIHTLCLFIKRLQHAHSTFLLLTVPPNSSVSLRATCKDLPRILPPKNQSASSSFKYFLPELPWRLNGQDYLLAMQETQVQSLVWEDPLEKRMATHIQILARRIPWMEEPCRPQSMGSQRVRHAWVTARVAFTFTLSLPQRTRSLTRGPHSNLHVNFTFQFERGSYYVVINFNTVSASITDQY